jgi:hypothetical protein
MAGSLLLTEATIAVCGLNTEKIFSGGLVLLLEFPVLLWIIHPDFNNFIPYN